jgi:NAD(P)-dependent dehydrogenase (short-subunit alcohol dehydrogenase family)
MGVDIVKAALAAGHAVVATGRDTDAVARAVGNAQDLLVAKLDVTSPDDAKAAVAAALKEFGRIDVLVNNAGTSTPGSSRRSPRRTSERRSRRTSSAR